MPNTTIPATGEATPEISMLILGSIEAQVEHVLKKNELTMLSIAELHTMMELLVALDDVTCAFLNQPRFSNGRTLNKAGDLGNDIGTHLSRCIALVEQAAKDAGPTTKRECEQRAWLLLQRAAHYADDLPRFIVAAAQLGVSVSNMEDA